jgi:hypothetical protein
LAVNGVPLLLGFSCRSWNINLKTYTQIRITICLVRKQIVILILNSMLLSLELSDSILSTVIARNSILALIGINYFFKNEKSEKLYIFASVK